MASSLSDWWLCRFVSCSKLQKQVDGAAALAEDNAFRLLAALGKSEQAQALQAVSLQEGVD